MPATERQYAVGARNFCDDAVAKLNSAHDKVVNAKTLASPLRQAEYTQILQKVDDAAQLGREAFIELTAIIDSL